MVLLDPALRSLGDSGHTPAFIPCTRSLRSRSRIANDFDRGAGNQAAGDHLVKMRNQLLNLLLSVNHTHHDGSIFRDGEAPRVVDPGAGSEAFETPIGNRTRNLQILTPGNN